MGRCHRLSNKERPRVIAGASFRRYIPGIVYSASGKLYIFSVFSIGAMAVTATLLSNHAELGTQITFTDPQACGFC